jgi:hypothetical protein
MAFLYELLHIIAAAVLAVAGIGYDRAESSEDTTLPHAIQAAFSFTGDSGEAPEGVSMTVKADAAQVCVDVPRSPEAPAPRAI